MTLSGGPRGPGPPHALLDHLEAAGFAGAPRALGIDSAGREILTFIDGETVGSAKPWPSWVHADETLSQVARWLRRYHEAVADFVPPPDAVWRLGGSWSPGLIIGHNDAGPYNAAWQDGALAGFFDWDFAAPVRPEWDLAYTAFSWVPLHARSVVAAEGFTDFAARPRRLRQFLAEYGWTEDVAAFPELVAARLRASADGIRRLAQAGETPFALLLGRGAVDDIDHAISELADLGLT